MDFWIVDFEYHSPEGMTPKPICMVGRRFLSGETVRVWLWDSQPSICPIPVGPDCGYVAFAANAELGCHLALDWKLPVNVLDLYVEFRWLTSGRRMFTPHSLHGALLWFGLAGVDSMQKHAMRRLSISGGPYSIEEQKLLMDYCESDVSALEQLLGCMLPHLDLPRALLRGRYMGAVARVERTGVPIDLKMFRLVTEGWHDIKSHLVRQADQPFGIFEGMTFKSDRWLAWCLVQGIPWPRLPSGAPDLKRETFRAMARLYPKVLPIHELRSTLAELRLNELAVGSDGRHRYQCRPFGTKTGRNAPSSTKAIFGPSRWIRHLIKPQEGMALAYLDWSQQELGIAAWLSGDEAMQTAYRSEDPYLAFAKLAGAAPRDATRHSHPHVRETYKVCALAVLMGMGAEALGVATGTSEAMGQRLLQQHKVSFPRFWAWSDSQVDRAMLGERLHSVFGWQLHPENDGPTTFRNFALQANGAEMLRLAVIAITERNIRVCAMVHDAVLIEAPIDEIDHAVSVARGCMASASRAVLGGFELGTDSYIIKWPDRYRDARGASLWNTVTGLLANNYKHDSI